MARWINLALLGLFPLAWFAPLMRAGLLPFFGGTEISVISGVAALWDSSVPLAILVVVFAMVAPLVKTLGLAALHWGRLPARAAPLLALASKLAMADVFLVALYIVAAKGVGLGHVTPAWGLWLFTGCVLVSLALSLWAARGRAFP